jgi:hypothetical protein
MIRFDTRGKLDDFPAFALNSKYFFSQKAFEIGHGGSSIHQSSFPTTYGYLTDPFLARMASKDCCYLPDQWLHKCPIW